MTEPKLCGYCTDAGLPSCDRPETCDNEQLRADAERYRWLRDNPWPPELEVAIVLHKNARWDAAIDAAMKESR